jgi:hypothetical protein
MTNETDKPYEDPLNGEIHICGEAGSLIATGWINVTVTEEDLCHDINSG